MNERLANPPSDEVMIITWSFVVSVALTLLRVFILGDAGNFKDWGISFAVTAFILLVMVRLSNQHEKDIVSRMRRDGLSEDAIDTLMTKHFPGYRGAR